jgi:hypothetical protein
MKKATEMLPNLYHAEYQRIVHLDFSAQISFLHYLTR